jgi:hypothetical protein
MYLVISREQKEKTFNSLRHLHLLWELTSRLVVFLRFRPNEACTAGPGLTLLPPKRETKMKTRRKSSCFANLNDDIHSLLLVKQGLFTKFYIYRAPQCISSRRNWDSPNPSPASEYAPPDQRVGGHTCLRLRGWGSPNSDDWRKSVALCLLSGFITHKCYISIDTINFVNEFPRNKHSQRRF